MEQTYNMNKAKSISYDSNTVSIDGKYENSAATFSEIASERAANLDKKFYQKMGFWPGFLGSVLGIGFAIPTFGLSCLMTLGSFLLYYALGNNCDFWKGFLCGFIVLASVTAILIGVGWLEPILAALASLEPYSYLSTFIEMLALADVTELVSTVLWVIGTSILAVEVAIVGICAACKRPKHIEFDQNEYSHRTKNYQGKEASSKNRAGFKNLKLTHTSDDNGETGSSLNTINTETTDNTVDPLDDTPKDNEITASEKINTVDNFNNITFEDQKPLVDKFINESSVNKLFSFFNNISLTLKSMVRKNDESPVKIGNLDERRAKLLVAGFCRNITSNDPLKDNLFLTMILTVIIGEKNETHVFRILLGYYFYDMTLSQKMILKQCEVVFDDDDPIKEIRLANDNDNSLNGYKYINYNSALKIHGKQFNHAKNKDIFFVKTGKIYKERWTKPENCFFFCIVEDQVYILDDDDCNNTCNDYSEEDNLKWITPTSSWGFMNM